VLKGAPAYGFPASDDGSIITTVMPFDIRRGENEIMSVERI
jgi:hypothetical protein